MLFKFTVVSCTHTVKLNIQLSVVKLKFLDRRTSAYNKTLSIRVGSVEDVNTRIYTVI